jgi:hypothetical protein
MGFMFYSVKDFVVLKHLYFTNKLVTSWNRAFFEYLIVAHLV